MTILFLFLLLFLLMFIGVPIAVSLGLSGALTILLFSPDSVRSLAIKLFETSEHYTLLAIGTPMNISRKSSRKRNRMVMPWAPRARSASARRQPRRPVPVRSGGCAGCARGSRRNG